MEHVIVGEFSDEYQDWLGGEKKRKDDTWLEVPIRELGTSCALTAAPSDSVRETTRRMSEHECGAVVVVEYGTLVGIFTERDVCTRVVCTGLDAERTRVGDVMTKAPATVLETDTLGQALRVLVLGGYRHVPVVDGIGQPINVISVRRIMEHVAEFFPEKVFNAPLDSQPPAAMLCEGG